jgi:hypothetical protein
MGRLNSHLGGMGVNPAATKGKRHDLLWEVFVSVWANQATEMATEGKGHRKVSRDYSSPRELAKGQIFYGKERTETLDGCATTARHVDPVPS